MWSHCIVLLLLKCACEVNNICNWSAQAQCIDIFIYTDMCILLMLVLWVLIYIQNIHFLWWLDYTMVWKYWHVKLVILCVAWFTIESIEIKYQLCRIHCMTKSFMFAQFSNFFIFFMHGASTRTVGTARNLICAGDLKKQVTRSLELNRYNIQPVVHILCHKEALWEIAFPKMVECTTVELQ